MGLATIDPHSHKVQTKFYKIPKFGVNKKDTCMYGRSGRCSTKRPDGHTFLCKFSSFQIAVSQ